MEVINCYIHPLEVPLIMDLILDFIPASNWKTVRLLNKSWYSRVQERWRDQTFVIITPPVLQYLSCNHPTRKPEDPYQFGERPFRNVRTRSIEKVLGPLQCLLDAYLLKVIGVDHIFFWQSYGPWLKRLHLVKAHIADALFLEKLIYEFTPSLQELQYVHCSFTDSSESRSTTTSRIINNCRRIGSYTPPNKIHQHLKTFQYHYAYDSKSSSLIPIKWLNFLSVCQNIQELRIVIGIHTDSYTNSLLKAIEVIRNANDNKVLNLTEFSAPKYAYPNANEIITTLCRLSLPLSTLSLNISKVVEDNVVKLIESHRNTLKTLNLIKSTSRSGPDFTSFPYHVLPKNLKKLTCIGLVFPTLGFLEYTPNLEELEIQISENDTVLNDLRQRRVQPLCQLKTVRYTTVDLHVSDELVKMMTFLTPNLTIVSMNVDHGGFVELCSKWTALEQATLGLIQITESQFVKNITNLQGLKSLDLYCYDDKFKDPAIYDGFLKLPKLTKLAVVLSSEVTPQAMKTLREKIKDTSRTEVRAI